MPDNSPGVALADYRKHGANVELFCTGCAQVRDFDLEVVIARLDARGMNGEAVGIREVARYVTEPCPRCGGTVFESRPAFPDFHGQAKRH